MLERTDWGCCGCCRHRKGSYVKGTGKQATVNAVTIDNRNDTFLIVQLQYKFDCFFKIVASRYSTGSSGTKSRAFFRPSAFAITGQRSMTGVTAPRMYFLTTSGVTPIRSANSGGVNPASCINSSNRWPNFPAGVPLTDFGWPSLFLPTVALAPFVPFDLNCPSPRRRNVVPLAMTAHIFSPDFRHARLGFFARLRPFRRP